MNIFLLVSKSQLTAQSGCPFQPAFENLLVLDLLSTIRNVPDYLGGVWHIIMRQSQNIDNGCKCSINFMKYFNQLEKHILIYYSWPKWAIWVVIALFC